MVQFHSQNICRLCFLRYHLKLWCECNLRNLINWFGMLIAKICAKLSTHQLPISDPLKACIDLRMFNFGKNVLYYWSLVLLLLLLLLLLRKYFFEHVGRYVTTWRGKLRGRGGGCGWRKGRGPLVGDFLLQEPVDQFIVVDINVPGPGVQLRLRRWLQNRIWMYFETI